MVSIIIVNYNTREITRNCINSILNFTLEIEFEIIVVDNASVDGSQQMIKTDFPTVILIELEQNVGFGGANNIAVDVARGEYVLFLNSDTILIENSIKTLLEFYKAKELENNIGALGCLLIDQNYQVNGMGSKFPSCKEELLVQFRRIPLLKYLLQPKKIEYPLNLDFFEIDYVIGADLMVNKSVFKLVGGFSPEYFMYYEESDLQVRLRKLGKKSFIITTTKIVHLEDASGKGISHYSNTKRIITHKSKNTFLKNHSPNFSTYMMIDRMFLWLNLFNRKYSFSENKKYIKAISQTYIK